MTQEQKRIAIAEACGWSYKTQDHGDPYWCHPEINQVYDTPPDYPNDLNATQEFKHVLEQRKLYWQFIELLNQLVESPAFSTAAQRAEAFGLTLGLWKEGE